ncbi:hypothetical protein C3L33_14192, partial [Rhododendron williamsianum]
MHSPSYAATAATATTAILLILVSVAFSPCYSQLEDEPYYTCVHNFSCGQTIRNVSYPFWGDSRPQSCGHPSFRLTCQNNEYATIEIDNQAFRVHEIDQYNRTITLASADLWERHCTRGLQNITLDNNLFTDGPINRDLLLFYNCTSGDGRTILNNFTCEIGDIENVGFFADAAIFNELENYLNATISCKQRVEVQVYGQTMAEFLFKSLTLEEGLRRGFEVVYDANIETACVSQFFLLRKCKEYASLHSNVSFQIVNFDPAFPIDIIQFRMGCDFVFHAIPRQRLDNSCNSGAEPGILVCGLETRNVS